jgi:hypothetical protein
VSWQAGDEGRITGAFKDTQSGLPIDWANTTAVVTVKPPGGAEAPITSETHDDGTVTALYEFELAGTYTGHITLTGEYRRKVPWKLRVFAE